MTSNIGARQAAKGNFGFATGVEQKKENDVQIKAVKDAFPPELYNRIDAVINFEPLGEEDIKQIAQRMINELAENLTERYNVSLELSTGALDKISTEGFDAEFGARPLTRYLKRTVIKSLTDAVINGIVKEGSTLKFDDELKLNIV